jgi:hypothetical protein
MKAKRFTQGQIIGVILALPEPGNRSCAAKSAGFAIP